MTRSRQTADWGSRAGLAKIVPSSVAVGSGTGSADSLGNVTFSGASSISINGCFSSTYQNYRIVFESVASTTQDMWGRMRASGTDLSSSVYGISSGYISNGTISVLYAPSGYTQNATYYGNTFGASKNITTIDVFRPNQTDFTEFVWQGAVMGSSNPFSMWGMNAVNNTTSYDGFTFYTGAGTFSGTVRVYGYTQ